MTPLSTYRLFPYLRLSEDPKSNSKPYRELEKYLMAMQAGSVHATFRDQLEPGVPRERADVSPRAVF